ncbi:hypothetical protein ABPG72_001578 [Tetrahymena utriculariae]
MSKLFSLKTGLAKVRKEYKHQILAPVELKMEKEICQPGSHVNKFILKACSRTSEDKQLSQSFDQIKDIVDDNQIPNHGLISLYNQKSTNDQSLKIKPKLAICITMYNEARKELESSLDGILRNMKHFKKNLGIQNEEIVVVVIYDGIDKINNEKDPDDNMIEYFKLWDRVEGSKYHNSKFTIPRKYEKFKEQLERSKFQVEQMRNDDFKVFKQNEKLHDEYKKYISAITDDVRQEDAKKADFLYSVKQKAQKYIDSKSNNAILYQMRERISKVVDQNQEQEDKNTSSSVDETEDYLHIFHCIKYKNGGKLSSHLWFFCGFCELFQPEYTILLDCGLVPDEKALVNMYLALETDKDIGGVCGFMGIKLQNVYNESGERTDNFDQKNVDWLSQLYEEAFSIQKAQMFEYNMGHLIDKPFESLFGFIQVLPGAFSGYRWEALKRDDEGNSILDDYLASVLDKDQELTLEQQNMNLAEDRILCLKIFSKKGKKYTLRYIRNATARVDPVTDLVTLVGQRRRWINGSFFALLEALKKKSIVYESEHSTWQLFKFKICMKFAQLNNFLGYVSLSVFFTIVFIMILTNVQTVTLDQAQDTTSIVSVVLTTLFLVSYFMCILMIIYYSIAFNNRNPKVISSFYAISTYLGIIMLAAFGLMMAYVVEMYIYVIKKNILGNISIEEENRGLLSSWKDETLRTVFSWIVVLGFAINIIPILWYPNKIIEIIKSFIHYMAYQAQYIHLLLIYAICRIDDLSWGTKNSDDSGAQQELSKQIKFKFVAEWFITNVAIGIVFSILLTSKVIEEDEQFSRIKPYILFLISIFLTGQLLFRILFATIHEIYFLFFRIQMRKKSKQIKRNQESQSRLKDIRNRLFNNQ